MAFHLDCPRQFKYYRLCPLQSRRYPMSCNFHFFSKEIAVVKGELRSWHGRLNMFVDTYLQVRQNITVYNISQARGAWTILNEPQQILIIDDEEDIRESCERVLSKIGLHVATAPRLLRPWALTAALFAKKSRGTAWNKQRHRCNNWARG